MPIALGYLPRRSLTNDSGLNRADSSEITFINICIISQERNYLLDPRCRERFVINLSRSTRRDTSINYVIYGKLSVELISWRYGWTWIYEVYIQQWNLTIWFKSGLFLIFVKISNEYLRRFKKLESSRFMIERNIRRARSKRF